MCGVLVITQGIPILVTYSATYCTGSSYSTGSTFQHGVYKLAEVYPNTAILHYNCSYCNIDMYKLTVFLSFDPVDSEIKYSWLLNLEYIIAKRQN